MTDALESSTGCGAHRAPLQQADRLPKNGVSQRTEYRCRLRRTTVPRLGHFREKLALSLPKGGNPGLYGLTRTPALWQAQGKPCAGVTTPAILIPLGGPQAHGRSGQALPAPCCSSTSVVFFSVGPAKTSRVQERDAPPQRARPRHVGAGWPRFSTLPQYPPEAESFHIWVAHPWSFCS
jgi:hypothetical protein